MRWWRDIHLQRGGRSKYAVWRGRGVKGIIGLDMDAETASPPSQRGHIEVGETSAVTNYHRGGGCASQHIAIVKIAKLDGVVAIEGWRWEGENPWGEDPQGDILSTSHRWRWR